MSPGSYIPTSISITYSVKIMYVCSSYKVLPVHMSVLCAIFCILIEINIDTEKVLTYMYIRDYVFSAHGKQIEWAQKFHLWCTQTGETNGDFE